MVGVFPKVLQVHSCADSSSCTSMYLGRILKKRSCLFIILLGKLYEDEILFVHVGLAESIEHTLLMLEVRGSNPENTTSLPETL